MNLYLTEGFGDKKIDFLGSFKNTEDVNRFISNWKKENVGKYKIEMYQSMTECDKGVIIDFGDWHYFMLLENSVLKDFR